MPVAEPDLQRLADGFLAVDLTTAELTALKEILSENSDAARELARQVRMHGALMDLGAAPLDVGALMARLPRKGVSIKRSVMAYVRSGAPRPGPAATRGASFRSARRLTLGAAAVTLAAAAWMLFVRAPAGRLPVARNIVDATPAAGPSARPSAQPTASVPGQQRAPGGDRRAAWLVAPVVITSVAGRVLAFAGPALRPLVVGNTLLPGEGLMTVGPRSQAGLDLGTESHVEVGGDSVIPSVAEESASVQSVFVARGSVWASAQLPSDRSLVFVSPNAKVTLASAQVRVQVAVDTTSVTVSNGRARVQGRDVRDSVDVAVGQRALVVSDGPVTIAAGTHAGRHVLFVIGTKNLRPTDQAVKTRLDALGMDTTVTTSLTVDVEQARQSDLIIVSGTIAPQDLDAQFRDLPVPILTWEAGLYPILGMAGSCEGGQCGYIHKDVVTMVIRDAAHPLAAGLSGAIPLTTTGGVPWATPNVHAAWIATVQDDPQKAILFAYEQGSPLFGFSAPARRVGFLLFSEGNPDGSKSDAAWKLFDRAVRWCLGSL